MNSISPNNNNSQNNNQRQMNTQQARQKKCSIRKQNAISDFSMSTDDEHQQLQNTTSNITITLPINKTPSLTNLNVPITATRKMSLQQQPSSQQLSTLTNNNNIDQQQTTTTSQLNFNNNNNNNNNSNNAAFRKTTPPSSNPSSVSPITTGANNGAGGINNLAVNNNIHLMPRRSVIGSRLERSSFQAQRLSDVGVAVGQQITAKMGLKLPASQERIVEQTRWLYLRYVFSKLRQHSLPLRDLNLTKSSRARRAVALGENVPEITCSAPATSEPLSNFDSSNSPFMGFRLEENVGGRKRAAMSQNIDRNDLNILATRMKSLNNNNPIHFNSIDNRNTDINCEFKDLMGDNSDRKPEVNFNNINHATNKKYIMDTTINNQIFTVISNMISELRELKPEYYGDTIYELVGIDKFSSLQSLLDVQMTICQEMTRSEISWCRIAALFSLFGAMSLDCVRLGAPEHVGPILEGFIGFVERDLALWISQQGGWESFLYKHKTSFQFGYFTPTIIITIIFPIFVWGIMGIFR